jgi:hypothetical protein
VDGRPKDVNQVQRQRKAVPIAMLPMVSKVFLPKLKKRNNPVQACKETAKNGEVFINPFQNLPNITVLNRCKQIYYPQYIWRCGI